MGAVGFVSKAEHPGGMGHLHDGFQVGADAVIGRVIYQNSHSVGVFGDGLCHLFPFHAEGDAQTGVHLGVDVDRNRTAKHQRVDDAAVDIARQDDLIAPFAGGQDHALHCTGGAADHQERMGCTKGFRRQLFRFPDDRYRVAEVVQRLHAVDVHAHALLTKELRQLRVAAAALVARHIERNDSHLAEPLQCLVDGRVALTLRPRGLLFLFHSLHLSAAQSFSGDKKARASWTAQNCSAGS